MAPAVAVGQKQVRRFWNLVVLRLLLSTYILLMMRFAWLLNHAEKWDAPPQGPLLILCEFPALIAAYYIASANRERSVRGAGMIFGMGIVSLALVPPLYLFAGLTIWDTQNRFRNLVALQHFLPICLLAFLCLSVCAFRQGKGNRRFFWIGSGLGAGYIVLALVLIVATSVRGSGSEKEKKVYQANAPGFITNGNTDGLAVAQVRALTACLIRHRYLHPGEGFPASLEAIEPDWNCSLTATDPGMVPGFWLFYSPLKQSFSGSASDFRMESVPSEKGSGNPVASDKRGEIITFFGLSATAEQKRLANLTGHFSVQTIDSDGQANALYTVRNGVRQFMHDHNLEVPPHSLDGVPIDLKWIQNCEDDEVATTRLIQGTWRWPCYTVTYSPGSDTSPASFAISTTCASYGQGCLRSFFLDYDGTVHATAEPRPATAQDPELEPCETHEVCSDPIWTPAQPNWERLFFEANVRSAIYSTDWW